MTMRNNTDKTIPPRHPWIEAMRLRTLPAGVAGVICGSGVALALNNFQWLPALICLIFSLLAQIASNFANEYFDYRNGLDRKGREGFRRGVTEGDISPRAMLYATSGTLAAACLVGLTLIYWGGWILIPIGILIAIFALMYSAGPYPLSHHGLGDLAVIIFFGIVPVTLTAWLQYRVPSTLTAALLPAIGTGLLASNILIVNNYRDVEDDRAVSKHTTVVIFGRKVMSWVYLSNVVLGIALICGPMAYLNGNNIIRTIILVFSLIALASGISIRSSMLHSEGRQLNDILKRTAILLLLVTVTVTLLSAF